jgi:hypothetical protein
MENLKVLTNVFNELEESYKNSKTLEDKKEIVNKVKYFLTLWKKMEGRLIEKVMEIAKDCGETL